MPSGQDYYLLVNNVPHGPYTAEQIQDWIKSQSSQADLNSVSFAIAGSSNWQPVSSFYADLNCSSGPVSDVKQSIQMTLGEKIKSKNAVVLLSLSIGFAFVCFVFFKQIIPRNESSKATVPIEDNRIKIKDIYLGMSIEDACVTLQKKFNEIPELSSRKLIVLNTENVGWGQLPPIFDQSIPVKFIVTGSNYPSWVIASEKGKVFFIHFMFPLVEALYNSKGMDNLDFIRTFMKVNGIPEMDKKISRNKNVEFTYLSPKGERVKIFEISDSLAYGCTIEMEQERSIDERIGDFK